MHIFFYYSQLKKIRKKYLQILAAIYIFHPSSSFSIIFFADSESKLTFFERFSRLYKNRIEDSESLEANNAQLQLPLSTKLISIRQISFAKKKKISSSPRCLNIFTPLRRNYSRRGSRYNREITDATMATDNNHPLTSFSWPFLITFGNKREEERERERESGSGVAYSRKNCLGRRYGWKFERQRPAKLVSFEEKMSRARWERLHGRVGIEEYRREREDADRYCTRVQWWATFVRSIPKPGSVHGIS